MPCLFATPTVISILGASVACTVLIIDSGVFNLALTAIRIREVFAIGLVGGHGSMQMESVFSLSLPFSTTRIYTDVYPPPSLRHARACGFDQVGLLDLHPLAGNPSGIPDFLLDLHPPAGNPSGNLAYLTENLTHSGEN